MKKTINHLLATMAALLLLLNSCKKIDPPAEAISEETISANAEDAGRLGFTNYNRNLTFYALTTDNKIDQYSTVIPKRLLGSSTVTGLQTGENLLAIDFRPATGQLYGLGSSSRLYVINPATGVARAIGSGPFTPLLVGEISGFDFNPTVDRIRIITSSGQNLRANPETGGIAFTDIGINGQAGAIISGAAYTNNASGATSTTLYDIDSVSNSLYIQNPPNDGVLTFVGSLGLDVQNGGFDIAGINNDAFGMFTINNRSNLIAINLTTGQGNIINDYPASVSYRGFAIATQPVAYAIDGTNNLVIFNPQAYYSQSNIGTIITKPLTNVAAGESIVGIDFRPLNGQLYALGSNSNIYTVNLSSGAVTLISTLSIPLSGTKFGFDFNPVVDRIRIISNTGQNLRFNPLDFTVIRDSSLNPGAPSISAAAYSSNFAGTTTTTLFAIDSASSQLVQINPPNLGTVVPVGNLGTVVSGINGFDIGGTSGIAYTLFKSLNNRSRLYTINTTTGQATGRGIIGTSQINGLAIAPGF